MTAIRFFLVMTLLTGVVYPVSITLISQAAFYEKAAGSFVYRDGIRVGSNLIGQEFNSDRYFKGRASAVGYNPMPSGGSNLSPASTRFRDQIRGIMPEEANLKMASGSGLDPHVTPEAALRQIDTVASARQLNAQQKKVLVGLVRSVIESPDFRLLGEPRVNVLALNLAVDTAFPTQ